MKEWDLDSYHRKFHDTVTVFQDELGQKHVKFVNDICPSDDGNGVKFKLNGTWFENMEPTYTRFPSRIYKAGSGYTSIIRILKKSYKIGLCDDNYRIITLSGRPRWIEINPLKPLEIDVEKALKKDGPISDKLFITPTGLFYLNKQVGYRKGSKFLVSEVIEEEVRDALRGHECSISS